MPAQHSPVRVAVVGTGGIVTGCHLPAVQALGADARLVAAAELDPARLASFREAAGGDVAGYSGPDALPELLDEQKPDLVLIGTPPFLHAEQTVAALESGAWVLCEKPMTLSLAEYDRIAAAEEGSGAYASVVFQHRYSSAAVHLRELLRRGELGQALVAHCQTTWFRDEAYYAVPWRKRWSTEGGGPTMGHGIHQMDLMLSLLGEWSEVRAMAGRLVHDVETEDVSTALVRFASGTMATVVNTVLAPREASGLRIDCRDATVEADFLYSQSNENWTYTPARHVEDEARVARWRTPAEDVTGTHGVQLALTVQALRAGVRPPGSGQDARGTLEFLAALYKSAFTGRPVAAGEIGPGDPFYEAMHGDHPDWAPTTTEEAAR